MSIILKDEIEVRNFKDWSMGYEVPNQKEETPIQQIIKQADIHSNNQEGGNQILEIMKRIYDRNR